MPDGKPAGVRCVQLDKENLCLLFGSPERPDFCDRFQADLASCGNSRDDALSLLANLEKITVTA